MMFVYSLFVRFVGLLLPIVAFFNKKIALFVSGRKESLQKIAPLKDKEVLWFHVASLGEFEQARPLIEELKTTHPNYKILLTFFSPSGYQVRKDYALADVVCYLPLDSPKNMNTFVGALNLKMVVFVKYEFWPNLLTTLKNNNIATILVSGIFREKQLFFKPYGGFMRKALQTFNHFFVQDLNSKHLLNTIHLTNVTVAGDTRFDRVFKQTKQNNTVPVITDFKQDAFTIVAGSTWPEDEGILVNFINETATHQKFIVAPHNIKSSAIVKLQNAINKPTVRFTDITNKNIKDYQVLLLDTIGLLTKVYASADVAYVGGGLKTGLHNILEPATFGIPVIIGHKFSKFKEAKDLVTIGGCLSIKNTNQLTEALLKLEDDVNFRTLTGTINKKYVAQHLGATNTIINYMNTKL